MILNVSIIKRFLHGTLQREENPITILKIYYWINNYEYDIKVVTIMQESPWHLFNIEFIWDCKGIFLSNWNLFQAKLLTFRTLKRNGKCSDRGKVEICLLKHTLYLLRVYHISLNSIIEKLTFWHLRFKSWEKKTQTRKLLS